MGPDLTFGTAELKKIDSNPPTIHSVFTSCTSQRTQYTIQGSGTEPDIAWRNERLELAGQRVKRVDRCQALSILHDSPRERNGPQ